MLLTARATEPLRVGIEVQQKSEDRNTTGAGRQPL
jgi:hypothetical protein